VYNKGLSRRRVRIEHVMARLKRSRLLGGRFSLALGCYPAVMQAAALINNLEQAA
jgi:hypothetical protein